MMDGSTRHYSEGREATELHICAPLGGGGWLRWVRESSDEQHSPSEFHLVPVHFSLPVSATSRERRSSLG
jgi:hypothetical protein